MSKFLYRLGKSAVRNRRRFVLGWLAALLVVIGLSSALGGETVDEISIPGTESQEAADLLDERFPAQSGASAQVVFEAPDGTKLAEPANVADVEAVLAEASELEGVIGVSNPFETGTISQSGEIGFADVRYEQETKDVGFDGAEALQETAGVDVLIDGRQRHLGLLRDRSHGHRLVALLGDRPRHGKQAAIPNIRRGISRIRLLDFAHFNRLHKSMMARVRR